MAAGGVRGSVCVATHLWHITVMELAACYLHRCAAACVAANIDVLRHRRRRRGVCTGKTMTMTNRMTLMHLDDRRRAAADDDYDDDDDDDGGLRLAVEGHCSSGSCSIKCGAQPPTPLCGETPALSKRRPMAAVMRCSSAAPSRQHRRC